MLKLRGCDERSSQFGPNCFRKCFVHLFIQNLTIINFYSSHSNFLKYKFTFNELVKPQYTACYLLSLVSFIYTIVCLKVIK